MRSSPSSRALFARFASQILTPSSTDRFFSGSIPMASQASVPEGGASQQPQRAPFNFKAILQQMVQVNGSDLHLKVGRPPTLRINGDLSPMPLPALRPEDLSTLAK